MTLGLSSTVANALLDALGNATNYTAPTAVWIKLHTADPGSAGTSNAATETTRKQASFAAASGGSMASDAAISWTNISGSQDATHFSAWDASTSGNFLFSGTITANAYTAGDTYTVASGALTVSLNTAA
jgi:hypothetical protein